MSYDGGTFVNADQLVATVWAKTKAGRLIWQTSKDPYELMARFADAERQEYVLRMVGVPYPTLTLETRASQVLLRAAVVDASLGEQTRDLLKALWAKVEIDGRSKEEVADDALRALGDL